MRAPDFWRRGSRSAWPVLLAPLGTLYAMAGRLRRTKTMARRAPVPVVCVGNLVAGGAGKTPTAIAVARHLIRNGVAVHMLSRGYGGRAKGPLRVDPRRHTAADVGDEPLLLAEVAPTWVARDRPAGALAAVAAGAEAIVMDDGHQNPTLAKDISIVVIDTEYGIGNGRIIPAGPLREPVDQGMKRADAIIMVGPISPDAADARVRSTGGGKPLLRAEMAPGVEAYALTDRAVVAFAGIARPEKFFNMLAGIGAHVLAGHAFPDHHPYRPDEIMTLVDAATADKAVLVTTAKDFVRLPPEARPMVQVVTADLEFEDPGLLDRVLAPVLRRAAGGAGHA